MEWQEVTYTELKESIIRYIFVFLISRASALNIFLLSVMSTEFHISAQTVLVILLTCIMVNLTATEIIFLICILEGFLLLTPASVKSVVEKIIEYEKFQFADTNKFYSSALALAGKDATMPIYMNGQIKYADHKLPDPCK